MAVYIPNFCKKKHKVFEGRLPYLRPCIGAGEIGVKDWTYNG